MDELAYSLNGENVHYGTPTNVAAPGRIPGGSSSGSAVRLRLLLSNLQSPRFQRYLFATVWYK